MKVAPERSPFRLGLTGGIGSGKSTVAARLQACGATLIDADHISRSLTASGGIALPLIAQAFGADLIDAQGALNRARMRELVFADPSARQRLEAILHPLIAEQTRQQHEAAVAAGSQLIVHDIPLLVDVETPAPVAEATPAFEAEIETEATDELLAAAAAHPRLSENIVKRPAAG